MEFLYSENYEYLESLGRTQNLDKDWNIIKEEINSESDKFGGFPRKNNNLVFSASIVNETSTNINSDKIKSIYRKLAYRYADLNPLYRVNKEAKFIQDMNIEPSDQVSKLNSYYLKTYSAEFEYVSDKKKYNWLAENFEKDFSISKEDKEATLWDLMEADGLEGFLHKRFPSAKRFSVEGADSSILIFERVMEKMAELGCEEVVVGMAHRGRLNFLTKVCGESYGFLLGLFQGKNAFDPELNISGDVKYHLGASHDRELSNGKKIHISLIPNPSHLETVNPLVIGNARAKQDAKDDTERKKIVPFLVHGEAAFSGQGIIYETMAMNNLPAYDVGGCIHLIIDNQVGFTAGISETRSTAYSSELGKFIEAPIFHVSGDDPEACIFISKLVAEYRMKFGGDVIINLVCYRRYGHNEGDEPAFTQPTMYKIINAHPTTFEIYSKKLISEAILTQEIIDKKAKEFYSFLDSEMDKFSLKKMSDLLVSRWSNFKFNFDDTKLTKVETGIKVDLIPKVIECLTNIPKEVAINSKIKKVLDTRASLLESTENIDYGTGEMLSFISLLNEGINIRISGEDVLRGTFAHRHAAVIDQNNDSRYFYYKNFGDKSGARFEVYNSILSEYGVMGFDYGYSLYSPNNLVIWEAQYGDFVNGAQIMIDQYISGAEQKWGRLSNLVLMLPHGYEGQGPEHSSARIERFLQLCAQYNMRVIQPTTPANIFHALRRQLCDVDRKPLIIFTPKSLLRHKLAVSKLEDFLDNSSFEEIITSGDIKKSTKIILCTGKTYYELYEKIISEKIEEVFLIKIEQLYPFPLEKILQIIKQFKSNIENFQIIWCQDEPKNMGAYTFVNQQLIDTLSELNLKIKYCGRHANAATACGSTYEHSKEQKKLIEDCFN